MGNMTHYQVNQISGNQSYLSFTGVPYADFDRTGHWAIWNVCKMFEAARLLSFYHGYIDFPKMDSELSGFFIVKHVYKFEAELHKTVDLLTPLVLQYHLQIVDIGKSSVTMTSTLTNRHSGEFLGENIFKYIYVDRRTRRPKALPDWWMQKYGSYKMSKAVHGMGKSKFPESPDGAFCYSVKARHSDTDKNGHVNNAVYVRLCMDTATLAAMKGHYRRFNSDMCHYSVLYMEAHYVGESNVGDELDIRTWEDTSNNCRIHFMVFSKHNNIFYANILFDPEKAERPKPKLQKL